MKKLNDKIKLAIARYFHNRDSQFAEKRVEGTQMTVRFHDTFAKPWNKEADRKAIDRLAIAAGFSLQAAPGIFWFRHGNWVITCTEKDFLDGGTREKRVRKPTAH